MPRSIQYGLVLLALLLQFQPTSLLPSWLGSATFVSTRSLSSAVCADNI
jgi:hypothetical protein